MNEGHDTGHSITDHIQLHKNRSRTDQRHKQANDRIQHRDPSQTNDTEKHSAEQTQKSGNHCDQHCDWCRLKNFIEMIKSVLGIE